MSRASFMVKIEVLELEKDDKEIKSHAWQCILCPQRLEFTFVY